MNTTNKKGFTLIELLVVVAIIGILSTIGLVALNGARGKARDAKRASDLRQYSLAYTSYFDSASTYVTTCGQTRAHDCLQLQTFFGPAGTNFPEDPSGTAINPINAGTCTGLGIAACRLSGGWSATAPAWYTIAYESNAAGAQGFGIVAYFEAGSPGSAGAHNAVLREDGRFCVAANNPAGC